MGMRQCVVDPCVFCKWSNESPRALKPVVGCHVDDSIVAGSNPHVDKHMDEFENHLKIERLGTLKKHLGVWWSFKNDKRGMHLEGSMEKIRK